MKRIGSKGYARARAAEDAGEPPPSDREDDDEDDKPDAMAEHEPLRAAAEEAHTAAASAYAASKGSDSAALLMAADDAGDAAGEAHDAAKTSSAKMRGATVDEAPPSTKRGAGAPPAAPAPPGARLHVAGLARAIAATGGTAEAQAKMAGAVRFADAMATLFGGASLEETEGLARAAHQDASDAAGLRAAAKVQAQTTAKRAEQDAAAALRTELSSAVRAGKYTRAELFDVSAGKNAKGEDVEVLTPQAWVRDMAPAARAAMIAKKQARAAASTGAGPLVPDDSPVHISAAVADYCARRGITDPAKIAALAAQMGGTAAAQETAPA